LNEQHAMQTGDQPAGQPSRRAAVARERARQEHARANEAVRLLRQEGFAVPQDTDSPDAAAT
jgi:hypothetical protein